MVSRLVSRRSAAEMSSAGHGGGEPTGACVVGSGEDQRGSWDRVLFLAPVADLGWTIWLWNFSVNK